MAVELFGLPGSGKSTLARELARALPVNPVGFEGRRELLALNLRALARDPVRYVRRTSRAFHAPGHRRLQYYKLRHLFLQRNALVESARAASLAVVDEGHVSNVLSAFEEPLTEARLLAELRLLDLPEVLVHVTLADEERRRRLAARGYASRSTEPPEYLARWEAAMRANAGLVARVAPRLPLVYVAVDGAGPPAAGVEAVTAAVTAARRSA